MPASSQSQYCLADVQKLNNKAAFYIEIGNHDKAITILKEALGLWEARRFRQTFGNTPQEISFDSECRDSTLDGCIAFSEQLNNYMSKHSHEECQSKSDYAPSDCHNKRRRVSMHNSDTCTACIDYKRKKMNKNHGYTYQIPIEIPKSHGVASTYFFAIMFNLALANHIKALDNNSGRKNYDAIIGALRLYELTFEYWSRLQAECGVEREGDSATSSLRFVMILFNNMSNLYQMVNNPIKQQQCLESLLSIVMIAVESNSRKTESDTTSQKKNREETFQKSIDGFLTNVMPASQCAEAA